MNEFNCDDKKYKFLSNSKVSIYTDIVGQEDDLWIIEAVIIPIALYDNIEICMNSQNVIRVSYQTKNGIYESEKCQLAIRDLMSLTKSEFGVDVFIKKGIPISSGLGGESANVVTILNAINIIAGLEIPMERLISLSGKYGNDAFFFSYNKPAYIIQRSMIPLPIENRKLLKCFIFDPQIYLAEYKTKEVLSRRIPINPHLVDKKEIIRVWNNGDLQLINSYLHNFITDEIVPEYQKAYKIAKDVYRLTGYEPQFTGSGPCMILIVDESLEKDLSVYCRNNNIKFYIVEIL